MCYFNRLTRVARWLADYPEWLQFCWDFVKPHPPGMMKLLCNIFFLLVAVQEFFLFHLCCMQFFFQQALAEIFFQNHPPPPPHLSRAKWLAPNFISSHFLVPTKFPDVKQLQVKSSLSPEGLCILL